MNIKDVEFLKTLIGKDIIVKVYNQDKNLIDGFEDVFKEVDFEFYTNPDYNYKFSVMFKNPVIGKQVLILIDEN